MPLVNVDGICAIFGFLFFSGLFILVLFLLLLIRVLFLDASCIYHVLTANVILFICAILVSEKHIFGLNVFAFIHVYPTCISCRYQLLLSVASLQKQNLSIQFFCVS